MGIRERREREKEQRRQDILTAAKEVFMSKGLSFTTMEDIANRAELSQGTLYLHFKNKEALFASLNLMTLQYIYDEINKISRIKELNPREKIWELKDVFFKTFQYDPLILRNILRLQLEDSLPSLEPELLNQINTLTKKTMALMAEMYEDGIRQGIFRKQNSMAIVESMWCMFIGIVLYEGAKTRLNPKKDFLKSTLDVAFEAFCRGITT